MSTKSRLLLFIARWSPVAAICFWLIPDAANAADYYSDFGQSRSWTVSLSGPATKNFEVNGIDSNRRTDWYVNGTFVETDNSGFFAIDPDYTYTFASGTTTIQAKVLNSNLTVKETHTWTVTVPIRIYFYSAKVVTSSTYDDDLDGYYREFDIIFDVDSESSSQSTSYFVKIYEQDQGFNDDYLLTTPTFSVIGSAADEKSIHIRCKDYPTQDQLGHGTAEFKLELYRVGETTPVQTVDGNTTPSSRFATLYNVKVETEEEDAAYTLDVSASPSGGGSVSKSPAPLSNGKYAAGTSVSLTASPATGYTFTSWSGAVTGSANPVAVSMTGNKAVRANFVTTDTTPPGLSITSHSSGQTVTTSSITLSGTATDSGRGNNGISSVTVDGSRAANDTASGSGTANWSKSVSLSSGANTLTVVAKDDSSSRNSATQTITITYTPPPTPTYLTAYDASGTAGQVVRLRAMIEINNFFGVRDSIGGLPVEIWVGGSKVATVTSTSLGDNVIYDYSIPAGTTSSSLSWYAKFNGNSSYAASQSATKTITITLLDPYGVGTLEPGGVGLFNTITPANRNNLTDLANLKNNGLSTGARLVNSTDRKLIIAIHGWNPSGAPDNRLTSITTALSNRLAASSIGSDWRIIAYDWSRDASTGDQYGGPSPSGLSVQATATKVAAEKQPAILGEENATRSAERAYQHGLLIGSKLLSQIGASNLEAVHLIGHSAGSWAVYGAVRYLAANGPSTFRLQATFLDPFIPADVISGGNPEFRRSLQEAVPDYCRVGNWNAHLAEQYWAADITTATDTPYVFTRQPSTVFRTDGFAYGDANWDGHGGPIVFYVDTINSPNHAQAGGHGWKHSLAYNEPTTVTIAKASGQTDPATGSQVSFTVTFSRNVTGFGNSSSDVTLSGTAGATTASVTGNGKTYNVAVGGMSQNGTVTITIPAGAAQDDAGGGNAAASTSATVTYAGQAVAIVPSTVSLGVSEGSTASMTVKLSAAPAGSVTVSVARISGDSDLSVDFGSSHTFTSSDWDTGKIVRFRAAEDADTANGSAMFRFSASSLPNVDVTVTEQDNDGLPSAGTFQFTASNYPVNENDGTVVLTVTRTGGSSGAVSVSYATANGTATAGSDYSAASSTLSWANGDTANKTITVPILNDSTPESSETFTVALSNPTGGATLGGIASVTVTIIDTSSPAGGLVANYSFENSGVDASANRNDATATGGTYGAGAIGSAFVAGSGAYLTAPDSPSLRITGHAISIAAWVNPTQFSGSGNRRTILRKMSQSGGSGGYLFSLDNNGYPQFGFQSGVTYYEQTATTWALPLNQWTHLAVTYDGAMVRFYTNGMPAPAIAQTGDLTADSQSLAIGRLSSADASEEFVGKLDEVQLYSSLLSFSEVQSLFALGRGTIQFPSASYAVTEGAGQISLTVTRLGGSTGAVGVDFSTANGSAIAGQDYTATNGTLNWGDGDMAAKTITVSILNDSVAESSENFAVRLFSPTGGANPGSNTNAIVTILDDDNAPPAGTFQISFVTVNGAQSNPVFDLDGTTRLGSSYYGQLYVGTTAQSLSAIGGPVAFLDGAGAGFIVAGTVTGSGIAGLYGGATGVYQLRVWNSSAGSTFEAAAASGSGRFGLSQIISTTFGGTDPLGGPPRIPPDANLHSSFSVALGTPPPSITSQPVGGTTSPGTNFTLSVSASGWGALTYQWWRNGSPLADGPRVSGALTRNLTILNARRSDSGKYSVIVANAGGSVTSSNATVRILAQSALERPWRNAAGNLVIGIRDSESGLLTTADMPTLELQFSTNFTNWVTVTNAMVLTNGQFQVEVSPTAARGFYRVIER